MATGTFKGWLWLNDGTSADPTAYIFNPSGLHSSTSVVATSIYIWQGVNEDVVQFTVATTASNLRQGGWGTFNATQPGARGSRGLALGAFELALPGIKYLCVPSRAFGYYDGGAELNLWVTCPRARRG